MLASKVKRQKENKYYGKNENSEKSILWTLYQLS